jgi:hypothetical protein
MFGIESGSGIYFNYVFALIWLVDVMWWWLAERSYKHRKRWIDTAFHGFMAFMFVNGAIVFAAGLVRWFSIAAAAVLVALFVRRKR